MAVLERLDDGEAALYAILSDPSGLDQAEFMLRDHETPAYNGVWRAWPFQWRWFRCIDDHQIDCSARSIGKTRSILLRSLAFPFVHTNQEMVITAPELNHLTAITQLIEFMYKNGPRLLQEMIPKGKNQGITHKPFMMEFVNGSRILGRIPQRSGIGLKGCIAPEVLVLTKRGLVRADEVVEGDAVWSHLNRWSPVRVVQEFEEDDCYEVRGLGAFPVTVSEAHQFYARKDNSKIPGKEKRKLGEPGWVRVSSMESCPSLYWTGPAEFPQDQAIPLEVPVDTNANCKAVTWFTEDFWWLVGRFLADGFTELNNGKRGRVDFVVHPEDQDQVLKRLRGLDFSPRVITRAHSSADIIQVCSTSWAIWLNDHFGKLASGKRLPPAVLFLPVNSRRALLQGYQSGDGEHNPERDNRVCSSSASKALTLGMGLLASSLGYGVGYGHTTRDSWNLRVTTSRTRTVTEDGYSSGKIHSVVPVGCKKVCNIISDDHSYLADGVFHHNSHPLWLEQDEGQDFTEEAWKEIIETLKEGVPGATWRCIAAGQMVLTRDGWRPIENVAVGDEVLTHKNRWRPVVRVFNNGEQECLEVLGQGHAGIVTTKEHEFYVSNLNQRVARKKGIRRQLGAAYWGSVQEFEPGKTQWASPALFPEDGVVPAMEIPVKTTLPSVDTSNTEWLWLYGLYLSEGYGADYLHRGHRHRRVYWCVNDVEAPEVATRLRSLGFKPSFYVDPKRSQKSVKVCVCSASCHEWLVSNSGSIATNKSMASWVLGLSRAQRQAIFDGLVYGDASWSAERNRWEHFTASRRLALDIKLLGQSLGYVSNISKKGPAQSVIEGRIVQSKGGWTIQMTKMETHRQLHTRLMDGHAWSPVDGCRPAGTQQVYDLEVAEDHSYVVEGMVVSNCHGVTKGVRDDFFRNTQPGSGWKIHKYTAMSRPTWSDRERQQKIQMYGSKNSPDYKRNILGQHGDASSPLFVAARLMATVDMNEESPYNKEVYQQLRITTEMIEEVQGRVEYYLDFPGTHKKFKKTWAGMDVGWTASPSEILVFGEDVDSKPSVLTLLLRIHLERLDAMAQAKIVARVIEFYKCRAFGFDSTGAGLPLFQIIQSEFPVCLGIIQGYGFSEKRIVELDQAKEVDEFKGDPIKDAGIERNLLDYSSDKIRELVDQKRIKLPWDRDLLGEWQGQVWSANKSATTDASGRPSRVFSKGKIHTLDAGKMMALAFFLTAFEEFLRGFSHREPVFDQLMGPRSYGNEVPTAAIW